MSLKQGMREAESVREITKWEWRKAEMSHYERALDGLYLWGRRPLHLLVGQEYCFLLKEVFLHHVFSCLASVLVVLANVLCPLPQKPQSHLSCVTLKDDCGNCISPPSSLFLRLQIVYESGWGSPVYDTVDSRLRPRPNNHAIVQHLYGWKLLPGTISESRGHGKSVSSMAAL